MAKLTPYAFKATLDEFVYYHALSAPQRPLVYRSRNSERLLSERANDKMGRPLVPRVFPGTPSLKKTAKFISLLKTREELDHFRTTLAGLANVEVKSKTTKRAWLKPSVVNAFLYKAYGVGALGSALTYVHSLENYKMAPRNAEGVALIRYAQIASGDAKYTKTWFAAKQASMRAWTGLPEFGSALLNVAELACQLRLGAVDAATLARVQKVVAHFDTKVTTTDFSTQDHAYSIVQALFEAAEGNTSSEIVALRAQLAPYVAGVEAIKGDEKSTFEILRGL